MNTCKICYKTYESEGGLWDHVTAHEHEALVNYVIGIWNAEKR